MEKSTLDDAMEKVRQFPSTANFQDLIQVRSKCKKIANETTSRTYLLSSVQVEKGFLSRLSKVTNQISTLINQIANFHFWVTNQLFFLIFQDFLNTVNYFIDFICPQNYSCRGDIFTNKTIEKSLKLRVHLNVNSYVLSKSLDWGFKKVKNGLKSHFQKWIGLEL